MRTIKPTALVTLGLLALAATGRAEDPTERRLRLLEEQLRKTQAEIQQLRDQLQQQRAIGQATQKQVEQTAEESKTAAAEAKKGFELPDWVRKTTLFGDVRFRHEGFYHQPVTETGQKPDPNLRPSLPTSATARNRERVRARLGLKVTLSDELSATLRVTSGDPNNPVSTNETLTGDFTRKHVNLDWAFITLTPGKSFGIRPGLVSAMAGKFPNPIFRVGQLVFDDDLSPEGASQTLSLLDKPLGGLDQVKVHVLEWTYNEVANGPDGWMFGGQVNPSGHLGSLQVEAGLGQYWWDNPNLIAQALNTNSSLTNTNLLTKNSAGSITGYESAFNQTNATLSLTLPNVIGTQPLQTFADYVYNWQAATDDAHGVMGGLKLGQTKVRGDWAISGYYEWLGQEAAVSSFTYDDFGFGGTNLEGSVIQLDYQLLNPLTLTARSAFTNYINRPEGSTNPTMTRLQLDAQVKF
jgi:hypothetical protein